MRHAKKIYIACTLIFSAIFFLSCKTMPDFDSYEASSESGTSLPGLLNEKEQLGANNKIQDDLLKEIEIASYNSLKKVVDILLSKPANEAETDKIYLYLALTLVDKLYPYANIEKKVLVLSKKHKYVEGLEKLKLKEYPYEMSRDDFFSSIIPALLLLDENIPNMFIEDAEIRINKAKGFNKASPLPYYLEGLLLQLKHQSQRAEDAFKKAITLDASFFPAILKYAKLCNDLGNYEEAIKMLSLLPEEYSAVDEVQFLNAFAHLGKKDTQKADPYIESVLNEGVRDDSTLFERVRLLIEKGEYMKANSLLNIYTIKNKTDKTYLLLKARIAKEWNKNDKTALKYIDQAYEHYPEDFDVLLECANIILDTSSPIAGKAEEFFIEQLLNIDAENVHTIKVLLRLEMKNENWEKAVSIAESLVGKNPSDENRALLLKTYLGNGDATNALRIASSLYRSNESPSNEVFSDYMEALYRSGNIASLQGLIRKYLQESKGETKSMLYYYSALAMGKNSENYLSLLRSALLTNPRNKNALFAIYEWYFSRRDYRNAQFYLKQAMGVDGGQNKRYLKLYNDLTLLLGT